MKKLFLLLTIPACSLLGEKVPDVSIPTPVRNCVQQTEPRNDQIKCKRGDWQQIGDPVCSSTEAICLKKKF
jgi:hypothetical protein